MKLIYLSIIVCFAIPSFADEAKDQVAREPSESKTIVSQEAIASSYEDWKQLCLDSPSSKLRPFFDNPPFIALRKSGANGIAFFIKKVDSGEDFSFVPLDFLSAMPSITRTKFRLSVVDNSPELDSTIFSIEEFPGLEIGRRAGQERELWLKWWAEKDAKIPIWFRGRYQMWKTAKAGKDPAITDAAYRKTVDLGIFALPQWMEKLGSDPTESKAIIAAVSELSSNEVGLDATPQQVKAWWKENRDKWTKVTLDEKDAPAK